MEGDSGTLSCVDFMDVVMGDIPLLPHVNTTCYNLTTLCLNGALPCVGFRDVIMGDRLVNVIGSLLTAECAHLTL